MTAPRLRSSTRLLPKVLPLVAALALGGCSSIGGLFSSSSNTSGTTEDTRLIDYTRQAAKTKPLDVPPDLTQLARDSRYPVQSGGQSVNASTFGTAAASPNSASTSTNAGPTVTPSQVGNVRLVREGETRRLVTTLSAETTFQRVKDFWKDAGFAIEVETPETGVIETGWAENRAKLPQDFIRSMLGKVLDSLYSTGERDRFRTRIERTDSGSEITLTHRGLQEVVDPIDARSRWVARPSDPSLEAELTYRLMLKLGAPEAEAQKAREAADRSRNAAAAAAGNAAGAKPAAASGTANAAAATNTNIQARARLLPNNSGLQVDDNFDRTWRRLGLALDRSGFTVEDRDRAGGLYFVRYIDKSQAEKAGLLERIIFFWRSDEDNGKLTRFRLVVKGEGDSRSTVTVLNANGKPDTGDAAQTILNALFNELR